MTGRKEAAVHPRSTPLRTLVPTLGLPVCITLCTLLASGCPAPPPAARGANVLLVTADSLRVDRLRPWNPDGVPVPALERLARRGVRYADAWATAPWTAPAVVSAFTGLHPTSHGVAYRDDTTPPGLPTLPRLLAERGYRMGNLSFFSGISYFRNLGLPEQEPGLGHSAPAESFRRFLDRAQAPADGEPPRPFFAWVHLIEPHLPYGATGYRATEVRIPGSSGLETAQLQAALPVGTAEFGEGDRETLLALYDEDVAAMDGELGGILDALDERGLLEGTLVVFVADHGEELLEHGWIGHASTAVEAKLVPEILRVPMVLAGPGVPEGDVVEELAQPVDLYPTLLALLGFEAPDPTDGVLLEPLRPFWRRGRSYAFFDTSPGGNLTPVDRRGERIQGVTDGACLVAAHHRPAAEPAWTSRRVGAVESVGPARGAPCAEGAAERLREELESWRAEQSRQRLAVLSEAAGGAAPDPEAVAGYAETLPVERPADGATLGWHEQGGQVRLSWDAALPGSRGGGDAPPASPATYWVEYRVGEGVLATRGAFPVEQTAVSFGPFPRGFWNDLARYSPFRFRVLDPQGERRSAWVRFEVRPVSEEDAPGGSG